jgi:hypothetical protein
MDSDDRKEKQDYLKREILDKGYDRGEFAEFMLNEKDDGLNVDNWEIRELIMTVDEFLSTHRPKAPPVAEPKHEEPEPIDSHQDYQYEEHKEDRSYGATEYQSSDHNDYGKAYDEIPDSNYGYADPDYGNADQDYGNANQDYGVADPDYGVADPDYGVADQDPYFIENAQEDENKGGDDFISDSEKRRDMMSRYEEEREKTRDVERDNQIEVLNKRKDEEKEKRKKKKEEKKLVKKLKKAEKEEQEALEKAKLEGELAKAIEGEAGKKFSDMVPKHKMEYRPVKETCKGIETKNTPLSSADTLTISLKSPDLKDEGFFAGKALVWVVETNPLGYKVERKDRDFNTLREYLVKKYPHVLIPACPEYFTIKELEKSVLRKRQSLLTRFINKLALQKEILASLLVTEFFTERDYKKYSAKLNAESSKLGKIKRIHDFATIKGECVINVTKRADYFGNALEKYCTSHQVLFSKFYALSKKLSSDLMEVASTLSALSQ